MDPVSLESGGYGGSYKLIGGEVSLDFVNTVSWPGTEHAHDWLDRPGNFTVWAVAAGILTEECRNELDARPPTELEAEINHVRQVREDLRRVLAPLASGEPPSSSAIDTLNLLVREILPSRHIDHATLEWTWEAPVTLSDILAPIIWNTVRIVTNTDHTRLGHCPSCNWLFYDATRNRSRRWCDMADCGSRDKALRYYHRSKPGSTSRDEIAT